MSSGHEISVSCSGCVRVNTVTQFLHVGGFVSNEIWFPTWICLRHRWLWHSFLVLIITNSLMNTSAPLMGMAQYVHSTKGSANHSDTFLLPLPFSLSFHLFPLVFHLFMSLLSFVNQTLVDLSRLIE